MNGHTKSGRQHGNDHTAPPAPVSPSRHPITNNVIRINIPITPVSCYLRITIAHFLPSVIFLSTQRYARTAKGPCLLTTNRARMYTPILFIKHGICPHCRKRSSLLRHVSLSRQWLNSGKSSVKGFLIDFDEFRFDCLAIIAFQSMSVMPIALMSAPRRTTLALLGLPKSVAIFVASKRHSRHFPGKGFQ